MTIKGENVGTALLGKQFVLTGSLETLTRDEAKEKNRGIRRSRHFYRVEENRLRRDWSRPRLQS